MLETLTSFPEKALVWLGVSEPLQQVIGWIGLGGSLTAGLLAAAVFIPGARRLAVEAALVVGIATALYATGVSHEFSVWKERARQAEAAKTEIEQKAATDLQQSEAKMAAELERQSKADKETIDALTKRIEDAKKAGVPDPDAVYDNECRVTEPGLRLGK